MKKKSKFPLDIYSLIAMLIMVCGAGTLLFREGYYAIKPWLFWLSLIGLLGVLLILVATIVFWLLSFSRAEHKYQLLFGSIYTLLIVFATGMAIINVMINQRYDVIIFFVVMIAAMAFSAIGIFKSGILDKKEEVAEQSE